MKLLYLLQALLPVASVAALLYWLNHRRRNKDLENLISIIRAESNKQKEKYDTECKEFMTTLERQGFEIPEVYLPTVTIGPEDLDKTKDIKE